jgi:hypothetical protein
MKLANTFANSGLNEIKTALDGGTLVVYSVARPISPDHKVERSGKLATFQFASPAFDSGDADGGLTPVFAANPVPASGTGTPGFARAFKADGSPVADFTTAPATGEVRLGEVSTTPGHPVMLTKVELSLSAA